MKTTKGMRVATVWKLCLEMWDWVAERILAGDSRDVEELKAVWCGEHEYDVELDCLFCDRSIRRWVAKNDFEGETMPLVCDYCPGADVFVRFDCRQKGWHWKDNPLKFRAKLHRMNKKRIKK